MIKTFASSWTTDTNITFILCVKNRLDILEFLYLKAVEINNLFLIRE